MSFSPRENAACGFFIVCSTTTYMSHLRCWSTPTTVAAMSTGLHRPNPPFSGGRRVVKNHHTGSDELVRERERRCRSSRGDVQLGEKVLNMPGNRVIADEQLVRDFM